MQAAPGDIFNAIDANGDGVISREEWYGAMAGAGRQQQVIVQGRPGAQIVGGGGFQGGAVQGGFVQGGVGQGGARVTAPQTAVMACRPRGMQNGGLGALDKLPADCTGSLHEDIDGEETDVYFSHEEVPWQRRPELKWTLCSVAALAAIVALFVLSLTGGGSPTQPQKSKMIPPELGAPLMREMVTSTRALQPAVQTTTTQNPLMPLQDRRDHSVCADNEEVYAGLCYKKCSALTGGTHSIRTSSWTCCEREPCTLGNSKGQVGHTLSGTGFDVGGDGNRPHEPGACLTNEELLLGVCYKKCSVLTEGNFPHRVGPATCCVSSDLLGCLNVRNHTTDAAFNAGGSLGDDDQSTAGVPHLSTNFTESAETASSYVPPALRPGSGGHTLAHPSSCMADEELYAGLCYKQCSLLTEGRNSIRTSSWTCCAKHPCGLHNQEGSVGRTATCNGYDVGGVGAVKLAGNSRACPHKPGSCGADEEMLLGMCYTKCILLTNGQFPYRLTADSCCKEKGFLVCLDIRKTATSSAFHVGILT